MRVAVGLMDQDVSGATPCAAALPEQRPPVAGPFIACETPAQKRT